MFYLVSCSKAYKIRVILRSSSNKESFEQHVFKAASEADAVFVTAFFHFALSCEVFGKLIGESHAHNNGEWVNMRQAEVLM